MDIEVLRALWANASAMRWVLILALVLLFIRYMGADGNPLEWWHFISSKGSDGTHYADLDKFGKAAGIIIGSLALIHASVNAASDYAGFAFVLTAYFAFVGGVAGYAAYLRSKKGRTETTTTTEPASDAPTKTTTTKSEPDNAVAG